MSRYVRAFESNSKFMYLVEQDVARPVSQNTVNVTVHEPTHVVFDLDFSGSMYGSESMLRSDMKRIVRTLRIGDAVTVMHFASRGDLKVALEGFKVTGPVDYDFIDRQIDTMRTRGCTNYTDGMRKAVDLQQKYASVYPNAVYLFMTDGYPNDDEGRTAQLRLSTEIGNVFKLRSIVGYGDYYNKTLLADLAQAMGGTLTHANEVSDFTNSVCDTLEVQDEVSTAMSVALLWPSDLDTTFYIGRKQFNAIPVTGNTTRINPMRKTDHVYTLTTVIPSGLKETVLTDKSVRGDSKLESIVKALYALGVILSQRNRTREAKQVFRTIGDVDVIQMFKNARTLAEFGTAENFATYMAFNPSKRFASGRDVDFEGNPNAYNLSQLFNDLMADKDARIHFTDPNFVYKTRSAPRRYLDSVPKYRYVDEGTPVNKLTFNKTRLNVSVFAERNLFVKLNADHEKFGFSDEIPAIRYQNFMIVCDGGLNVKTLPVSLSENTFNLMVANNVIDSGTVYSTGSVYSLHLDRLPLVNDAMTVGKNNASDLCRLIKQEFSFESQLRALRFLRDEIQPKTDQIKQALVEAIGPEKAAYLEMHCLKSRQGKLTFEPATEAGTVTDKYEAVEFDVSIDGCASVAAMSDILDKKVKFNRESGNLEVLPVKITDRQNYLIEGLRAYAPTAQSIAKMAGTVAMKRDLALSWLNGYITHVENQLKTLRKSIQEWKFAVILSQDTFVEPEFQSRQDETAIVVDGTSFKVSLSKKWIDI